MTYTVLLKRTHELCNHVKTKEGRVIFTSSSPESAAVSALRDASDSQISQVIFGDTGMDDGDYKVEILSITDSFGEVTHSPSTFSWKMQDVS